MMSETGFNFPEWQTPLHELLLEFDREKLTQKSLKVENLLYERLQQLNQQPDGHGEREAISDALNILRVLKRDKLDFPDWQ